MSRYLVRYRNGAVELFTISLEQEPAKLEQILVVMEQGIVSSNKSDTTMPRANAEALIAEALSRGLMEISKADFDKILAESKAILEERFQERDGEDFRLVPWSELAKSNRMKFTNNPEEYLSKYLRRFRVYDRNTKWKGDLKIGFDSLGPDAQTGSRNLVFSEGLEIDGNFDAGSSCDSLPQFIHVKGDLFVKNLILTGWVELVVTGNVYATGVVFGYDGESGGQLKIDGDLTASNVLGGGMYPMYVSGKTNGKVHWFRDDEPTLNAESIIPDSIRSSNWNERSKLTPLSDTAYYEDIDWVGRESVKTYSFNCDFAVASLRDGKPLFR